MRLCQRDPSWGTVQGTVQVDCQRDCQALLSGTYRLRVCVCVGGGGGLGMVRGQTAVNKKAPIHYLIPINDMVHRPL